jgi:predicted DsbA family dithiol-disulfide isomerase
MRPLRVDVWSDIACPWCYVGKRRLEAALARFLAPVEVVWRAFELQPSAPREEDGSQSYAERLARKYGVSVQQAEAMIARMTEVARADGLDLRFDRVRAGNTFDAHRVLHLAHERGVQEAVKERFLRAYFSEGEPIGDPETLSRLAGEAGLDPTEVGELLHGDGFAREVRADEAQAHRLGIEGVPFFVLGGRTGVSGAQPSEVLLGALEHARRELGGAAEIPTGGEACGPDGCD